MPIEHWKNTVSKMEATNKLTLSQAFSYMYISILICKFDGEIRTKIYHKLYKICQQTGCYKNNSLPLSTK